ncbi:MULTISPECIES: hypothetical protein [unclassified Streptomyces]|uniref:hypothetical protein n=1 Tax=unclassified Streptomyces TaxID=2593676 RepID=UPI00224D2054|nr:MULTISPECIES: hypothetical protein [unclassified Streptomyces]MCX5048682.1 hypothetical protein [Streptomyces sp. NBC_00474]MCX5056576.1 hypothetical protein [Streptomyces sp. NBC_00452]MCX5246503.1 hypothetical protein [Streptomyces sp. NBC_00201]MCX5287678.1 hypothetical protein [Streptomyces sp. NBC_00183]
MARGDRRAQGLVRVAVVVRAGAAPLWWAGVFAAGVGVLAPGITGRRIGVMAGAALFVVAAAVVACARRGRYAGLARSAARAGRHDVLQDRAITVRNWRRGHRWWLLLAFVAALAGSFAVPAAGGMLLAGCGTGLRLKAAWLGQRERAQGALLWVRVDWLAAGGGRPVGKAVRAYRSTGIAAGDAAPGGARRRTAALV